MIVKRHRKFKKQYKKLSFQLQNKVDQTIEIFKYDPFDFRLRNHKLTGKLEGKRAISVSWDLRIIFEEFSNYTLVIMLDIGTHKQVYK